MDNARYHVVPLTPEGVVCGSPTLPAGERRCGDRGAKVTLSAAFGRYCSRRALRSDGHFPGAAPSHSTLQWRAAPDLVLPDHNLLRWTREGSATFQAATTFMCCHRTHPCNFVWSLQSKGSFLKEVRRLRIPFRVFRFLDLILA